MGLEEADVGHLWMTISSPVQVLIIVNTRDLFSHFEWHNPVKKSSLESLLLKEILYNMYYSVVINEPADGLAPCGARPSAGTVMTTCGSCIYTGLALKGLK